MRHTAGAARRRQRLQVCARATGAALYFATSLQEVPALPSETSGAYRYDRLIAGSYLLAVESIMDPGFLGELYIGVPCHTAYEPCDLLRGTPVTVSAGGLASGIDLYLRSNAVFGDGSEQGQPGAAVAMDRNPGNIVA